MHKPQVKIGTQTFSNRDGSRAKDEHAATNQQLPSFPCVTSWLLIPSTNSFGGSGAQMSYVQGNNNLYNTIRLPCRSMIMVGI